MLVRNLQSIDGRLPWDLPEVSVLAGHKPYLQQLFYTFEKVSFGVGHLWVRFQE